MRSTVQSDVTPIKYICNLSVLVLVTKVCRTVFAIQYLGKYPIATRYTRLWHGPTTEAF